MDHPPGPLSPDEQDRVAALLARFVQNYERLQQAGTLAGMETSLFSPISVARTVALKRCGY
jgi:hypothetical protein